MTQSNNKKIVAITGGIGSGKTVVSGICKRAGYKVVSCDTITAELYKKSDIKRKIAEIFPTAAKGKLFIRIDKKKVAKECFENADKLKKLNALLHPVIIDTALKRAKRGGKNIGFVEIPLLFETDSAKFFDRVIIVKRELCERIKAVCERSGLTVAEVEKRINSQYDYDKNDLSGFIVIVNDGDLKSLEAKTMAVLEKL